MEEVGIDGLTQGGFDNDASMTGMNNLAGMASLNALAFDQSIRHADEGSAEKATHFLLK